MNSDYSDHDGYAYLPGNQEPELTKADVRSEFLRQLPVREDQTYTGGRVPALRKLTAAVRREKASKKACNRSRRKAAKRSRRRNR